MDLPRETPVTDGERTEDDSRVGKYDVVQLLQYRGPIRRQEQLAEEQAIILDYCSSDENERNISVLLSSQGINFTILRPPAGWRGPGRMVVTVPKQRWPEAQAVLAAAAAISLLDVATGTA
jgi:hypothetical protein